MISTNIIRRREIQCSVLLLYVAVAESYSIIRELDSGKTIIMETGGKANTTVQSILPEEYLTWSFEYYTLEDLMVNKLPIKVALKL